MPYKGLEFDFPYHIETKFIPKEIYGTEDDLLLGE
jgi:hypothetical protein